MSCRSIMSDIKRDNRVVSLSSRAGIRNSLVTILDQLQRCQKSLNEFLEVRVYASPVKIVHRVLASRWILFLCVSLRRSARHFHASISSETMICWRSSVRQPTPLSSSHTSRNSSQVTFTVIFSRLCTPLLFHTFFSPFFYPAVMCIRAYFAGRGKAICVFTSAGIHSVVFDDQCQHIVAMCSLEGEIVPLRNLVRISSLVEVKLICLKTGLKEPHAALCLFSRQSVSELLSFFPGVVEWALCGNEGDSEASAVWVRVSGEEGWSGSFSLPVAGTKTITLQISSIGIIKYSQKLLCLQNVPLVAVQHEHYQL